MGTTSGADGKESLRVGEKSERAMTTNMIRAVPPMTANFSVVKSSLLFPVLPVACEKTAWASLIFFSRSAALLRV